MNIASAEEWLRPTPIATGAVLFALGALLLAPEMLVAGAFCIVAGIIMTTVEWIDNEMAQGLVIIATGLVVLGALTIQMKRAVNRPTPGAQVA
jgi:intracellular septation protein A